MSEQDTDKPHEASQRKLEKARKKGEFARSSDMTTATAFCGFLLVFLMFGETFAQRIIVPSAWILSEGLDQQISTNTKLLSQVLHPITEAIIILFTGPIFFVLVYLLGFRGIVFAPEKLKPKLSKVSPINKAQSMFGRKGLFEFTKNTIKLCAYSCICVASVYFQRDTIFQLALLPHPLSIAATFQIVFAFFATIVVMLLIVGSADFIWQVAEHLRKNRMSTQEMKDEHKESEGDPHMKSQRKQKAQEIVSAQISAAVPNADVIIVNPEHYAVVLKWDRSIGSAPKCTAKGIDHTAATIRALAKANAVPIYPDPPLARALHAATDVGQEVPVEQFAPVAAAIRFAEAMRLKVSKKPWASHG